MPKLKPTCPRKTKNTWSPWIQSGGCSLFYSKKRLNYVTNYSGYTAHKQRSSGSRNNKLQ